MAPRLLAAVDLGSNSFRLIIGRIDSTPHGEQVLPVDTLKETVRLAAGLNPQGELDAAARERGLAALMRFGERLRSFRPDTVRAVATSTLRQARNAPAFLATAQAALGFPIEVIAGREEARLIYAGASHALPADGVPRLVVDIGGGSTECIAGLNHEPLQLESADTGCVALTRDFFASGEIRRERYLRAVYQARDALSLARERCNQVGWKYVVGTSGTARALTQVAHILGHENGLDLEALEDIERTVLRAGHVDLVDLPGLRGDRRPVIAGGLAAMRAVFDELGVQSMRYCDSALREGVLYEILGRQTGVDMREVTVARMQERHGLQSAHAQRVAATALGIFDQAARGALEELRDRRDLLRRTAQLCEVGLSVSHDDYHRHSAYLLEHSDMPGFSASEQDRMALLALGHAGGLRKMRGRFSSELDTLMLFALRLSCILHRREDDQQAPLPAVFFRKSRLRFELPAKWTAAHPLTDHLLREEVALWTDARLLTEVSFTQI